MTEHNILIVDDTPINLRLLVNILADKNYRVRPVSSGKMALRAAQAAPPDLILLDIMMPEMNGYEVCVAIKADPILTDVPVIFLSAVSEEADIERAYAVGAVDYIQKPFQLGDVMTKIQRHLAI